MELHRFSYEVRGLSRHTTLLVSFSVMPGLVPGIHVAPGTPRDMDGRDKPGHDDVEAHGHNTPVVTRVRLDDLSPQSGHQFVPWESIDEDQSTPQRHDRRPRPFHHRRLRRFHPRPARP
ncbi:hypothetical protein BBta_7168 [Bradyrhizobium sp. BTAi1]|nr:hypothetical protein BBta_7168 [Bradyrhizobium sp. BTAi1]